MRRIVPLLLAIATLAATAGPASAATTLGSLPAGTHTDYACADGFSFATGAPYTATSPGIITSWQARLRPGESGEYDAQLIVVRPGQGGSMHLVTAAPVATIVSTSASEIGTRIPIAAGQSIGLAADNAVVLCEFSGSGVDPAFTSNGGSVAFPYLGELSFFQIAGRAPAVRATVEPDADGDGYGDETQDQCPTDAETTQPCAADMSVTGAADPPSVTTGQLTSVTATVTAGAVDSAKRSVLFTVPAGWTVVARDAACNADALVICAVAPTAAGQSRKVTLTLRAPAAAGSGQVGIELGADGNPDPVLSNNTATVALSAVAPPATTPPTTTPPAADTTGCIVPDVRRLDLATATRVLRSVGCARGKVTKPKRVRKGAKLVVSKQGRKAGTKAKAGTTVALTLAVRR